MVILEILFYLLLIIFPLGVIPRLNIFSSVYISFFDVILCALIIAFIFLYLFKKDRLPVLFFRKDLIFFIIFSLFSSVLNSKLLTVKEFFISSLYAFRFLIYSLGLSTAFSFFSKEFKSRALFYMSLSGFIFVLFGFVQYFYYPGLKNLAYLGWDEHLYRIFSTFLDPNFAGSVFLLEIILLIYLLKKEFYKNIIKKIYFVLAFPLGLIAFFLTYSRSSYVSMIVVIISFLFVSGKKKLFLLFIAVFILGLLFIPKNLMSEGVRLFRTVSIENRIEQYKNALAIFSNYPIFGVGFNSYRYIQQRYGYLETNFESTHSGAGVPNSFLLVAATTGIIGLALFLKLWIKILLISGKKSKNFFVSVYNKTNNGDEYNLLVFFSVLSIFTQSLLENIIFYPFITFWIFVILGGMRDDFKVDK